MLNNSVACVHTGAVEHVFVYLLAMCISSCDVIIPISLFAFQQVRALFFCLQIPGIPLSLTAISCPHNISES